MDYALTAMFICLLVFQLRGNLYILVAIVAGGLAVGLSLIISGNFHIIISSIVAATLGVLFRQYQLSHKEEKDS